MKAYKIIIHSLFLTVIAIGLSACKATNQAGSAVVDPGGSTAPSPTGASESPNAGFLETDYELLANWLSERFEVKYRAMTPELIFDQVPLNDIHYNTSSLPTSAPAFDFESDNVSRRELLQQIATHWNLKMDFSNDAEGNPTAVNVSG